MNKLASHPSGSAANGVNGHSCGESESLSGAPIPQAQELTSLFLALTRQLLAIDDQAADLPLRQLRLCMLLYDGPRAMSSLSRELGVSQSAMTQIADRLERGRLVRRSFEGTDRRVRSLQLTPRGQKMMQLREAARVARAAAVIARMSPAQGGEVLSVLRNLLSVSRQVNAERAAVVNGSDKLLIRN
jgi:DNA-binding MarR family transcriptional regulator